MNIEEINAVGKVCGIYKITSPSSKVYIGSSGNIKRRWTDYFYLKCLAQPKLYNSFLKYGVEKHTFEVIEQCEFENLFERERHYQEIYNCTGKNGLNCYLVETIDKKKVVSQEMKDKMSKIKSERIVSQETKNRLSLIQKKLQLTSKKVVCLTTGKIFNSILELSEFINIHPRTLSYHLNRGTDIGYKLLDFQGQLKRKGVLIPVRHIPSQTIFNSITEAALYFNKDSKLLSGSIKRNSFDNEFEYLDGDMKPKKKNNKKSIIHLETGLKFNSMREAEIHFNFKKGYVKNNIKSKNSKFKILK